MKITNALTHELPREAPVEAPLFPTPINKRIAARDGRNFGMSNPAAIVAAFDANAQEIPVDLEHASEIKAPNGEPAPAVGWITSIFVRGGTIFAKFDWTTAGAALLREGAYRYLSPAFHTDSKTGEILKIVSVALTNRPALMLPALTSMDPNNAPQLTEAERKICALTNMEPSKFVVLNLEAQHEAAEAAAMAALSREDQKICTTMRITAGELKSRRRQKNAIE